MKRYLLLILCLAVVFLFAACGGEQPTTLNDVVDRLQGDPDSYEDAELYDYEENAVQLNADATYYNAYLGFGFNFPSGWWTYDDNTDNFHENKALTTDPLSMDVTTYGEWSYMDLGRFGNLHYSSRNNHIGINFAAEYDAAITTLEDFAAYNNEYMLEPAADGNTYSLINSDQAEINGRRFAVYTYEVAQGADSYYIDSYWCAVNENYFLMVDADYWPENTAAPDAIRQMIENNLIFL